jgi:hypothetical protein
MAVWCSLWSFVIIFSQFGVFGPRQIWQPCATREMLSHWVLAFYEPLMSRIKRASVRIIFDCICRANNTLHRASLERSIHHPLDLFSVSCRWICTYTRSFWLLQFDPYRIDLIDASSKIQKRGHVHLRPGTDVMILKIFSPNNLAKILAFFAQTTASFCKNCDHNIGFWEKRHFFRRKLAKIAENCDHYIDP